MRDGPAAGVFSPSPPASATQRRRGWLRFFVRCVPGHSVDRGAYVNVYVFCGVCACLCVCAMAAAERSQRTTTAGSGSVHSRPHTHTLAAALVRVFVATPRECDGKWRFFHGNGWTPATSIEITRKSAASQQWDARRLIVGVLSVRR